MGIIFFFISYWCKSSVFSNNLMIRVYGTILVRVKQSKKNRNSRQNLRWLPISIFFASRLITFVLWNIEWWYWSLYLCLYVWVITCCYGNWQPSEASLQRQRNRHGSWGLGCGSFSKESNIQILAIRTHVPTDFIHVHPGTSEAAVRAHGYYPAESRASVLCSRLPELRQMDSILYAKPVRSTR